MDKKQLHRSAYNKRVLGVCGGFAEYFNIDATIIRVIWAIAFFVYGTGLLAYIIAALVMPPQR